MEIRQTSPIPFPQGALDALSHHVNSHAKPFGVPFGIGRKKVPMAASNLQNRGSPTRKDGRTPGDKIPPSGLHQLQVTRASA